MKEPSIHDQELLMDELTKSPIEEQVKAYTEAKNKAKRLYAQSEELGEKLYTITSLVEETQKRLENEADYISREADINTTPRAHQVYWERWHQEEWGETPTKGKGYPSLAKVKEQRNKAEGKLLDTMAKLADSIGECDKEWDQKMYKEKKKLKLLTSRLDKAKYDIKNSGTI